ncbi:uncharacterized protein LOC144110991 isoform X4 [Amblyomma americanum]
MEESPVPNAVASRPLCRVKECPGAQVLLSDMWFVAAYGARKFSPPSSSNSEERTLPAVCGTSCFRCSQDERGPLLARVHTRRRHLGVAFRAGTRPVVTAAHGSSLSTFPASWCSARGYSSQALQLPGTR